MNINFAKKSAAILSIASNSFIIALKLVVGIMSGSVSIISEAIHSMSDFLASVLTLFSVVKSAEPADEEHPFGHGKYEDMSGFIEGGLIIFAAFFICYEAIKKMFTPVQSIDTTLGLTVMGISVILNIVVSAILFRVAKKSQSISLYADAEHLSTDVLSSLGIFAGLLIIKLTGLYILDAVIAIIVALIILKTGFSISKRTMNNLLDCSLSKEELDEICDYLNKFNNKDILYYKNLKARRLGAHKSIEVTFVFPKDMTILECHNHCDLIENGLSEHFGDISASIHFEPELSTKNLTNI